MSFERQQRETKLTALESKVVGQRLRVEHLRDALRALLDPLVKPEKMERENIFSLATDFAAAHIDLQETVGTIAKLKELLGR